MEKQRFLVPAILSLIIPGLGQIVKGQVLKGILILVLGITISYILWFTFIVPILIWAWNVFDAYTSQSSKNIVEDKSKQPGV